MSVVGVGLSSLRDLKRLATFIVERIGAHAARLMASGRALWRRMRGKKAEHTVHAISGAIHVASAARASASVWRGVPDMLDPAEAIRRLTSRTDALHEQLAAEGERRKEADERIDRKLGDLRESAESRLAELNTRIDDIDVTPSGQRAIGAVLVMCGTFLMFVGGLLG